MRKKLLISLPLLTLATMALACNRAAETAPDAGAAPALPDTAEATAPPQPAESTAAATEPSGPFDVPEPLEEVLLPDLSLQEFEHDGLERSFRMIIPDGLDPDQPAPLVLALHGGGGNSYQMCTLDGGVQELAEAQGFLVICPDAVENHWNDGRGNSRYRSQAEDIDDVGYLLALLAQVSSDYPVDPERIYVTGASNGGMMTQRLACEATGAFAAAAAVISSMPAALDCRPSRPFPMLFINGTDDPLMPYQGGQVHFYRRQLGEVLSTPETVAFWAANNGCNPTPESVLLDLDPDDGTWIALDSYSGCQAGAQVLLYTVNGGGHTWPGGSQYLPEFVVGKVSNDMESNQAIWGFFAAHRR